MREQLLEQKITLAMIYLSAEPEEQSKTIDDEQEDLKWPPTQPIDLFVDLLVLTGLLWSLSE